MSKERIIEKRGELTISRPKNDLRRIVLYGGKPAPRCKANVKTYGNIWVREIRFDKAGQSKAGHKHDFDHLHFLAKGRVELRIYADRDTLLHKEERSAPAWIKVPKEHFHDIVALEDDTLGYCIQALRNQEGEVVDTDFGSDYMAEVRAFESENGTPDEVAQNSAE